METYIDKYFDLVSSNIKRHLNSPDFSEGEKRKLNVRLELIEELRHNISWQFTSTNEKQASRLQWLASMRKSEAPYQAIRKQENAISIYEKIKTTIPYLEALNGEINKSIIDFLNEQCDKIDFSGSTYKGDFPENEEVKKTFKVFFEIIKPARGNGNMFKECYEKIESLYDELLKLNK